MKKGVFKASSKFWGWFNEIRMNTVKRTPATISQLDESGEPTVVWMLANAWPTRITGAAPKSQGNEVAIETIVFTLEGATVANA